MNRTLWQTILNIVIAVASAIVGALGGKYDGIANCWAVCY